MYEAHKNLLIFKFALYGIIIAVVSAIDLECKYFYARTNGCKVDSVPGNFTNETVRIISPGDVRQIKNVEIYHIHLGQLPNTLFKFVRLTELECWSCGLESLAKIDKFRELKSLWLSGNPIREIRKGQLRNPRIVNLYLRNNEIRTVDEMAFSQLPKLVYLDLSNNQISQLSGGIFRSNLENLESIKLSGNLIENIEGVFDNLALLREVDVSNNKVKEITNKTFQDSIELWKILLDGNEIETIELNAFKSQINLCWLGIGENHLKTFDIDVTRSCLYAFTLVLKNNNLDTLHVTIEPELSMGLILDASFNNLDELRIPREISVKSIDIRQNKIKNLAANLTETMEMDYSNNNISVEMFNKISALRTLKRLSLNDTGLDETKFLHLLQLPNLEALDVSHNSKLQKLDLANIDAPAEKLWKLEMKFCALQTLNLDLLIEKFPKLKKVALRGNKIDKNEVERLNLLLDSREADLYIAV